MRIGAWRSSAKEKDTLSIKHHSTHLPISLLHLQVVGWCGGQVCGAGVVQWAAWAVWYTSPPPVVCGRWRVGRGVVWRRRWGSVVVCNQEFSEYATTPSSSSFVCLYAAAHRRRHIRPSSRHTAWRAFHYHWRRDGFITACGGKSPLTPRPPSSEYHACGRWGCLFVRHARRVISFTIEHCHHQICCVVVKAVIGIRRLHFTATFIIVCGARVGRSRLQ